MDVQAAFAFYVDSEIRSLTVVVAIRCCNPVLGLTR